MFVRDDAVRDGPPAGGRYCQLTLFFVFLQTNLQLPRHSDAPGRTDWLIDLAKRAASVDRE